MILVIQFVTMQDGEFKEGDYTLTFHGVNLVIKDFPFLPTNTEFELKFDDQDAKVLNQLGLNLVRIGVSMEGLLIGHRNINQSYLQKLQQLTNLLEKHKIYFILDFHQDLLTNKACGNGLPDWLIQDIHHDFPFPFKPFNLSNCQKYNFGKFYFTKYLDRLFRFVYNQISSNYVFRDELTFFWETIAHLYKNNSYLLAYELINEPLIGSPIYHPIKFLFGTNFEKTVLQKFYDEISQKLLKVDPNHLIFIEPLVFSLQRQGLTPSEKQVIATHQYCLALKNANPISLRICKLLLRVKKQQSTNSSIVTEFGAVSKDFKAIELLKFQLEGMSNFAYWQYKDYKDKTTCFKAKNGDNEGFYDENGRFFDEKVKLISYPYFGRINGRNVVQRFSFNENTLYVEFIGSVEEQIELGVNKQYWEGFGLSSKVFTPQACKIEIVDNRIYLQVLAVGEKCRVIFY